MHPYLSLLLSYGVFVLGPGGVVFRGRRTVYVQTNLYLFLSKSVWGGGGGTQYRERDRSDNRHTQTVKEPPWETDGIAAHRRLEL